MMRPFACDSCSYTTNNKHDLKKASKVHFPDTYSKFSETLISRNYKINVPTTIVLIVFACLSYQTCGGPYLGGNYQHVASAQDILHFLHI